MARNQQRPMTEEQIDQAAEEIGELFDEIRADLDEDDDPADAAD